MKAQSLPFAPYVNQSLGNKWVYFFLLLLATNSFIGVDSPLIRMAALDTTIYHGIAIASPGLPPPGSEFIYHSAFRFYLPYLLGFVSKIFSIDEWVAIRVSVICMVGLALRKFSLILDKLSDDFNVKVIALCLLCFHVYLFRLQIAFSGFLSDTAFSLACIYAFSYFREVRLVPLLICSIAMIMVKQTGYIVGPLFAVWTFIDEKWVAKIGRRPILGAWLVWLIIVSIHKVITHNIIESFSTPESTKAMAFGFINWLQGANLEDYFYVLLPFLMRGFLSVLAPALFLLGAVSLVKGPEVTRRVLFYSGLFAMLTVQPLISGPSITGESIVRLSSYGVLPLILAMTELCQDQGLRISNSRSTWIIVCLLILASFHHLFSILGPDLDLRWIFISTHTLLVFCAASFFIFQLKLSVRVNT